MLFEKRRVPDFVEVLEQADLRDPGFKAFLTFNFGSDKFGNRLEKPGKVVLTSKDLIKAEWDVQAEEGPNPVCVLL